MAHQSVDEEVEVAGVALGVGLQALDAHVQNVPKASQLQVLVLEVVRLHESLVLPKLIVHVWSRRRSTER